MLPHLVHAAGELRLLGHTHYGAYSVAVQRDPMGSNSRSKNINKRINKGGSSKEESFCSGLMPVVRALAGALLWLLMQMCQGG